MRAVVLARGKVYFFQLLLFIYIARIFVVLGFVVVEFAAVVRAVVLARGQVDTYIAV